MAKERTKQQKTRRLLSYLGKNRLMTLGTVSGTRPWAATVFFAYDTSCNLLFYSRPDTKHCRDIAKNSSVSVVINQHWRNKNGMIQGLQMTGRAAKVGPKERAGDFGRYASRFRWARTFANDHVLYRIVPREVWLIDEKFFGHFYRVRML